MRTTFIIPRHQGLASAQRLPVRSHPLSQAPWKNHTLPQELGDPSKISPREWRSQSLFPPHPVPKRSDCVAGEQQQEPLLKEGPSSQPPASPKGTGLLSLLP